MQSGRFHNPSELLREGLRHIEERKRVADAKLDASRQAARKGWADVSAGGYADVVNDQFMGTFGRC